MKEGSTVTVPARASAILPVLTAWLAEISRVLISTRFGPPSYVLSCLRTCLIARLRSLPVVSTPLSCPEYIPEPAP